MISFRAHKLQVDQTGFTVGNYDSVSFPNITNDPYYHSEGYDIGGCYNTTTSLWTPVPSTATQSELVQFNGQLWVMGNTAFLGSGQYFVARIVKNGYPAGMSLGAKIGTKGGFTTAICGTEDWVVDLTMNDIANPGDSYGVFLYVPATGVTVNGISLHTWWQGYVVAP